MLNEHLNFCEEYRLFIVDNRQHFDSMEVRSLSVSVSQHKHLFYYFP
jgi:hypothetical protein